jgi:hypothetical protein
MARETKRAAKLEFKNKEMSCWLQELEAMLATSPTAAIPTPAPTAPPARWSTRIAGAEFANSAVDALDDSSSDSHSSNPNVQIILPDDTKKLPTKPIPRVPSKTRLPTPRMCRR